jgi:outer membrane lipoprotein-sorting protein
MRFLRTISTRRLLALCLSAVAIAAGGTAIAIAASGGGPTPPPKPLARAVHGALTAPQVQGITARVKFTNHLIDSSGIRGANPLLTGADGRLWFAPGKGFRIELQSDNGDAQVVANPQRFFVFDGTSNTVYQGKVPKHRESRGELRAERGHKVPSVARIQSGLNRARRHKLDISGPTPGNIAQQPAYTVRVAPAQPGGLFGAVELAWDAVHGLPLRFAVYARGNDTPVLELVATEISYGPVDTSNFAINPPRDAHVVNVDGGGGAPKQQSTKGAGFKVSAPATLAGRKRTGVRVLHRRAAVIRYGRDLNGLLVIEKPAKPETSSGRHHLDFPTVDVNGATAKVIDTPLGSLVTFQRNGVQYTVLGSVHADVVETAARGL